jgi:AraC-like DNA-binding protein
MKHRGKTKEETMQIPDTEVEKSHMVHQMARLDGLPEVFRLGFAGGEDMHPDRVLDFWVLGILTSGTLDLQIGPDHFQVRPHSYYLLPPHVRHQGKKGDETFDVIYFHFTQKPSENLAPTFCLPFVGDIPPELSYLTLYRFLQRATDFALFPPEQLNLQLAAIVGQLSVAQHYVIGTDERSKWLAYRVMDYLREHIEQEISPMQMAADLGYSSGHLDRVFREHFATSIHKKLLELRMTLAQELLLRGKPLKQVAAQVCFHDYRYFLKAFKRFYGTSPGALQRRS